MHRREQIYFITNKTELLNIITDKICKGLATVLEGKYNKPS